MRGAEYPRQQARTRRFTLGVPRAFTPLVGPDGPSVLFLRSDGGEDPLTHLYRHDPTSGLITKLVDAASLGDGSAGLSPEEQARRERAREQASGIVAYAVDEQATLATFLLDARLYTVDLLDGRVAAHPSADAPFDPRPAPDGRSIAYHAAGGLHLLELPDGPGRAGTSRPLVEEDGVAWGRAEFVAAEEMGRDRGFWWDGDGQRLAVARVDERAVASWTIADPADPAAIPRTHRYPAAGTDNATVELWILDVAGGTRRQVPWRETGAEYLANVGWGRGRLTLLVQSRDQRQATVLAVDPDSGATTVVRRWEDPAWVELVQGTPAWSGDQLLTVEDRHELGPVGSRALCVDGVPVTPAGLQVREVLSVTDDEVEVLASPAGDPTRTDAYRLLAGDDWRLTCRTADAPPALRRRVPGRAMPTAAGRPPAVEVTDHLDIAVPTVEVRWWPRDGDDAGEVQALEVRAAVPVLRARPRLEVVGERRLCTALLLPADDDGHSRLPVLLDPYGGPHAQRVVAAERAYLTSQWLANQGFAVLVVDGRGTPGRGPLFERAVHGDLAGPVLEDQLAALDAVAATNPRLDTGRVGIRGWSFGGYLAALAVLRAPDRIRAAIAGAPVTDWALYDTHYTERYLGHPAAHPEAYATSSLVDTDGRLLGAAPWPETAQPSLLLIHGLADDNVVAAHTLRLSAALLADGRDHQVLPLSGVTHMTPQEVVAERLLTLQVRLLRRALGGPV